MSPLRFLMGYIKRHKWHYILGIATLFIVDFANLYIPQVTGEIIDGLTLNTLDMRGVLSMVKRFQSDCKTLAV